METRLRELRQENGLRQKDVAEKIGVCTASYGFYENWINKPDPETLVKLANLYNVSIDYLLGLTDEFGVRTATPMDDTYTAEDRAAGVNHTRKEDITVLEEEMLDAFRAVGKTHGEKGQRALIEVANGMAGK